MHLWFLPLVILLSGMGRAAWFEENVYKDSKRVVEDDSSVTAEQRNGLLSVLLSLDKLYRAGSMESDSQQNVKVAFQPQRDRRPQDRPFVFGDDDDDDDDDNDDDEEVSVLKRVLPPLGELCRLMHMKGCSHSRHK